MATFMAFLENLRPRQWTKNLILFAGLIFAQKFTDPECVWRAVLGCAVFCLASGAVYIYNDIADIALDRVHPYKRFRPIASGRLPVKSAVVLATLLLLVCVVVAWFLGPHFAAVTLAFFLWNGFYTRLLKKAVILDVVGIAFSFVLRAIASVAVLLPAAPHTTISKWLLLCTFFLSLFLGFCKRRNEMIHVQVNDGDSTRPALTAYSEALLNVLIGISFTITLLVYTLYTIWPHTVEHFHTSNLVLTVPFVVYGLGRYLFLVYKEGRGGRPHEILLNDLALQAAVSGWIITIIVIIGLRP
jgi:4-hydroxybenzoate polyprenyltransferase